MSEDDDLLERLGALEREYDDAFPHEWEDVVRGTRTADEAAARRREAGDDPAEIEALAGSLRPLDAAERDAWVERLLVAGSVRGTDSSDQEPLDASAPVVDASAPVVDASAPVADASAPVVDADAEPPHAPSATVASLDQRRHAAITWATAAVGLLAAAALVLWLLPTGPLPVDGATALPPFDLVVRNETVHDVRSSPPSADEVPRYRADTTIHWVLRPERTVSTPLGVRVLAERLDGSERRLVEPSGTSVSERGVVELRGSLGSQLALSPGRWSLRFVLGTSLPGDVAALERGGPFTVVEPPYVIDVLP